MFQLTAKYAPLSAIAALSAFAQYRFRAFSVGGFLLASWLRSLSQSDDRFLSGGKTSWEQITPPSAHLPCTSSRSLVTYHPWYHEFHADAVNACLREAVSLGVGFVRTDVRWKDVLPDTRTVNQEALEWYRGYFAAAKGWYGLKPMVILSNPPSILRGFDAQSRMRAWERYVEQVALSFGDLCDIYQILNEPNNPVYRVFAPEHTNLAIRSAAAIIRRRVPDARMAVTFLVGLWNWKRQLMNCIAELGQDLDVIGLDYYPGTWMPTKVEDWQAIATLFAEYRYAPGVRKWSLAIMETGYSTNVRWFRGDEEQAAYYRSLERFICSLNRESSNAPLLVGLYELCDSDSNATLDPEAHFGLLRSGTLARKPAFVEAQRICQSLDALHSFGG